MSVRQYVIYDPPNIVYKQTQNDTTGMPSTVWQQQMDNAHMETQYIIHSDHPYLYRRNIDHNDSETQFRPLQLSKIITFNTTTLSMAKTRTGMMNFTTKETYSFVTKTYPPTDDEDDPEIEYNTLSRALIDLWQPNFEAAISEVDDTHRQGDHKAPDSLLDETAFIHLLVAKEREPSYVPLSTNLGLKFKRRMLYFPMEFGELTLDGLIDTGAHCSAIPEADLRKIRLLAPQSIVKESPAPSIQIMVVYPNHGRKWSNSTRMTLRNPIENSLAILTGKTQCYNNMRSDK